MIKCSGPWYNNRHSTEGPTYCLAKFLIIIYYIVHVRHPSKLKWSVYIIRVCFSAVVLQDLICYIECIIIPVISLEHSYLAITLRSEQELMMKLLLFS